MRRIFRRYLTRDPYGRPLTVQSERLTDDGRGWMQLSNERSAALCSGCHRPIVELSERRGVCDWCHARSCCVHCIAQCQVCARCLCGHCRRGFVGTTVMSVCLACQRRLMQRQTVQDELMMQQTAFERHIAQQRLFNQVAALRLMAERTQVMTQLQAARLGLNRQSPLRWAMGLIGRVTAKVFRYAWRSIS